MFKVSEECDSNGIFHKLFGQKWIRGNTIHIVQKENEKYYLYPDKGGHTFVLHPDERERFEAFLRGDDDPMWALVDELRNHPTIGIYPKQAAEDFSPSSQITKRPRSEKKERRE